MVTTGTIELYKNCKFDIYRNMSNFASLTAQNNYYAGLTKISKIITFNKIGDPIILEDDITDLIEYDYGRLSYLGKWWYFQVSDLSVNAQGRTVLTYTIDAWETLRYQYGLTLGAGSIDRIGYSISDTINGVSCPRLPLDCEVYYNGMDYPTKTVEKEDLNLASKLKPCVYGLLYSNTENMAYTVCQVINSGDYYRINTMQVVKYMQDDLRNSGYPAFENATLIGAWFSLIDLPDNAYGWTDCNPENGTRTYYLTPEKGQTSLKMAVSANVSATTVKSDYNTRYYIADERGNVIFKCPEYIDVSKNMQVVLNLSGASACWDCVVELYRDGSRVGTYNFSIPLEPLDIQNDAWATYQAQQRQIDIDTRNLQIQSNLVSGLANTGTNALNGALMGTAMAPGIGTAIGAIGGAVTGVISSVTNYATDKYYAPKEQELTDRLYKNASDNVNLLGSGINGIVYRYQVGLYSGLWQQETVTDLEAMTQHIKTYGFPVGISTDSVDDWILDGPFRCDCEVLNCPTTYGAQVQDRLRQGVYFDS